MGSRSFLRGVSIHAEAPYRTGRANTDKDAETLLGWAKELGANFVRLAHYPTTRRCCARPTHGAAGVVGESGLLGLQFDNPKVLAKATQQLDEEIGTSRNHAAIILWSMANETPNTEARTRFIETLAARAGARSYAADYRGAAGARRRAHQDRGRSAG
jgi:beta-glucuronidase